MTGISAPIPPTPPPPRVPVDLDLRVWGLGADGRPFSQHARARNISQGGALLSDIERDLKIGDTIAVQNGDKKARCKVVWLTNTRSAQKIKVGVQLLKDQECPWATLLPHPKKVGAAQNFAGYHAADRSIPPPAARQRHRRQRKGMLCGDAVTFSDWDCSHRRVVLWSTEADHPYLCSQLRSASRHGH
jgi:hypothetical protein